MLQLLAGASALAIAGATRFFLPIYLKSLAKDDVLYTIPPEMKGLIAVTGGKFHHAILASSDYHLNDPRKRWFRKDTPAWEVLPNEDPSETYDDRWPMIREFGGYWIGLPWYRSIYTYTFDWNEMDKDEKGASFIRHRKEETRYWFAMDFEYVVVFSDAKTSEGLPVRLEVLLTVRITNPYKALFETDDWLLRVTAVAERIAKDYAAGHEYAELRGEAAHDSVKAGSDSLSTPIVALTNKLPEEGAAEAYKTGTKGRYGITISAADLKTVALTGKAASEHEETSILEYNADRKAAARRTEAGGEADAIRTVQTAQAEMAERMGAAVAKAASDKLAAYAAQPELAATMMTTDAMGKPGEGKVVVTDIQSILDRVFKPKP